MISCRVGQLNDGLRDGKLLLEIEVCGHKIFECK